MAKEYGQVCPMARSLEFLGERWTLLIVRDLLRGPQKFQDLSTSLAGVAPAVLSLRLKLLEERGGSSTAGGVFAYVRRDGAAAGRRRADRLGFAPPGHAAATGSQDLRPPDRARLLLRTLRADARFGRRHVSAAQGDQADQS